MKIQVKVFNQSTSVNEDKLNYFLKNLDPSDMVSHRSFSNHGEICHTVTYYKH